MRPSLSDVSGALAEPEPDLAALKAYNRAKQALANEIRSLRQTLAKEGREDGAAASRDLLRKLAEDRFTLAVVGQFKRGKSSLMNAIIGRDLLPTGVLPVTSAITILAFGPQDQLVVEREKGLFPEEAPIRRLAQYVTEECNPGNAKGIKSVRIQVPVAFLRQGIEFVDTPGVGSAIEANTATTYEFLPQCDAALLVTSAEAPLTATEIELLAALQEHARRIVVVVNKMDLVPEAERSRLVEFVAHALRQESLQETGPLFPLSCQLGMEAKQSGDEAAYNASGLRALEDELGKMLSAEKRTTFLVAVADKALRLLREHLPADADLADRLRGLRERLAGGESLAPEPVSPCAPAPAVEHAPAGDAVRPEDAADVDLLSDLLTKGCPVCNHIRQSAFDFLAHYQYALSSDQAERETFAAEAGLCRFHLWQLFSISSPQGMSWGLPPLMEHLAACLANWAQAPGRAREEFRALHVRLNQCRLCARLAAVEHAYVRALIGILAQPEGHRAYAHSQGVCLPHLETVLSALGSAEIARFVLAHASKRFEELAEDMRGYATKHEALRRALLNSDEAAAYVRATIRLAGHQDLSGWRNEWPGDQAP